MPVVREFLPGGVQHPFSRVDAPAEAFGAGVGRALSNLSGTFDQAADELEKVMARDNARHIKELESELARRSRDLLHLGDDAYFNLRQNNAVERREEYELQLDKIRDEILAKAPNRAVRESFSVASANRLVGYMDRMAEHSRNEFREAENATSEVRIQEAVEDAAVDHMQIETSRAAIVAEMDSLAENQGWDKEVKQSKLEQALTHLHKQTIIAAMKRGKKGVAKAILDKYRKDIDGPVLAELEKMEKEDALLARTQATTDAIMKGNPPLSDALKAARAIKDPDLRKAVVNDVKVRHNENEAIRNDQERQFKSHAFASIYEGMSFREWKESNPEAWNVLRKNQRLVEDLHIAQEMASERRLYAENSDGQTLLEISSLSAQNLAALDLKTVRHRMTEKEFASAVSLQAAASKKMEGVRTDITIFNEGYKWLENYAPVDLMWDSRDQDEENKQLQQRLMNQMDAYINAYQDYYGHKPSQKELQDEARRLTLPATTATFGDWRDFFVPDTQTLIGDVEAMEPEERAQFRVDIDAIRPEIKRRAADEFRRRTGEEPSEDWYEQFFGAEIMRDRDRQMMLLGINPEQGQPRIPQFGSPSSNPLFRNREAPFMVTGDTANFIMQNEGIEHMVYFDSLGIPTVGVGFNLWRVGAKEMIERVGANYSDILNGRARLSTEQVKELFKVSVKEAEDTAKRVVPGFDNMSANRKKAFTDMAFNLGEHNLKQFHFMLDAVSREDWEEAADEAIRSLWYKQVRSRGPKVVELIRNG